MRKLLAALVPAVVGLATSAAADDGPELTPPSVAGQPADDLPKVIESRPEAVGAAPATPAPAPRQPTDNGSVLVVPGLTAPKPRKRFQARGGGEISLAPYVVEEGSPPLVGPSEMKESAVIPPPIPSAPRAIDPDGRPPLTLESVPAGEDTPAVASPDPVRRSSSEPTTTRPTPRRPGLFGRLLLPPPIDRRRGAVTVEPRIDPEEDAAIRTRVERQIRENLGTALRSYEVRVVGREVTVVARTNRFWQKRAVRNALEGLPAVKGYRTRVDVTD